MRPSENRDEKSKSRAHFLPYKKLASFPGQKKLTITYFLGTNVYVPPLQGKWREGKKRENQSHFKFKLSDKNTALGQFENTSLQWSEHSFAFVEQGKSSGSYRQEQLGSFWVELGQQHAQPEMLEGAAAHLTGSGHLLADPWVLWSSCLAGFFHSWIIPELLWLMGCVQQSQTLGWKYRQVQRALKPNLPVVLFCVFFKR